MPTGHVLLDAVRVDAFSAGAPLLPHSCKRHEYCRSTVHSCQAALASATAASTKGYTFLTASADVWNSADLKTELPSLIPLCSAAQQQLASRAWAQLSSTTHVLRHCAWEKLHSGPWQDVRPLWRDVYSFAAILDALLLSHSTGGTPAPDALPKALKALDLAIIMGGPRFATDAHALLDTLAAPPTAPPKPAEASHEPSQRTSPCTLRSDSPRSGTSYKRPRPDNTAPPSNRSTR
jgi:hypothetical protein